MSKTHKVNRSAKTGFKVTPQFAADHPTTTMKLTERMPKYHPKKK